MTSKSPVASEENSAESSSGLAIVAVVEGGRLSTSGAVRGLIGDGCAAGRAGAGCDLGRGALGVPGRGMPADFATGAAGAEEACGGTEGVARGGTEGVALGGTEGVERGGTDGVDRGGTEGRDGAGFVGCDGGGGGTDAEPPLAALFILHAAQRIGPRALIGGRMICAPQLVQRIATAGL